jgi:uncharacterized protein (TIGR03435 family)
MAEITIVAKATVVLAVALGAAGLLRRSRASLRALLLASAFGVVLVLPVATVLLPPRAIHMPPPYVGTLPMASGRSVPADAVPPSTAASDQRTSSRLPSTAALLRGLWLLGVTGVLVRLVLPLRRLRSLRRTGRPWLEAAGLVETMIEWPRRHVEVFLHDGLSAPMTFGMRRPVVGLPLDAPEWPEATLRHALIHEVAHIRRGDWPVHVLGRIVCAIYWFHPLAWIAARRLRLESERACDDAVLRHVEQTTYAEQLVMLARRLVASDQLAALSMAGPSQLTTRIRAVLDGNQARGPAGVRATLAVVTMAVALALTISPLRAVTESPQLSALTTIDPTLTFEVVSVKPNQPGELGRGFGFTPATGRVRLRNQTLRMIVSTAYAQPFGLFLPEERLAGGPDWFNTERFTIEGRAGRAATAAELGGMLRVVLAQRFNLKIRVETRQEAIHALVRTKPGSLGPELKQAAVDCQGRCGIAGGSGKLLLAAAPMYLLGLSLSEVVGTPVVDRTGLTGSFDGTLSWTPSALEHDPFAEPSTATPVPAFGPSVFTALEEQFGLKLVSERGPVEYFVVEHAERPIPNDAPDLDANP